MTFKHEVREYVKQKRRLYSNLQTAYLLVLGKGTELVNSKLKSSAKWSNILDKIYVLKLSGEINVIKLKFEDQKYLPLSIHEF